MKVMKIFVPLVVILVCFFLSGCTKPFVTSCREIATLPLDKNGQYGWTEEQAKAACADANRFLAGKMSEDKAYWEIDYTRIITTEEVLAYVKDQLDSLDLLLSYKDDENVRDINFFKGFRQGLEKQEKRLRWVEQRLRYVINYNTFVDKVGESDGDMLKKLMPYGRKAYSLRLLYPLYDLNQLKFTASYVEAAKKDGSLKLVGEFPIIEKKEFAEKIIDNTDPNKFIWKKHYRGWLIKAYKIVSANEQPMNPNIDYLEIYKAKFSSDNKDAVGFEEKFAVSGFKSAGRDSVSIFVIDYDFNAISGFSPDAVFETFINVVFGNEVYTADLLRKEVLEVLYVPPTEKEYRKKPAEKPLYVEIVKMGNIGDIKAWEEGNFTVPFSYNTTGPGKFYATLDIKWAKPATAEDKRIDGEDGLKQIDFFKVSYSKEGNVKVIEYYVPKKEYSSRDIEEGIAESNTYRIRRKNLPQVQAGVRFFSERVKFVEYEYGGRWYQILDKDGDGKFEKRRKIADPTEKSQNNGNLNMVP